MTTTLSFFTSTFSPTRLPFHKSFSGGIESITSKGCQSGWSDERSNSCRSEICTGDIETSSGDCICHSTIKSCTTESSNTLRNLISHTFKYFPDETISEDFIDDFVIFCATFFFMMFFRMSRFFLVSLFISFFFSSSFFVRFSVFFIMRSICSFCYNTIGNIIAIEIVFIDILKSFLDLSKQLFWIFSFNYIWCCNMSVDIWNLHS